MFAAKYQAKYESRYPRRRRSGPRRWLVIFLVSCLLMFSTLNPATTFSRYMVNLQKMFNLQTSHFYLTPSLSYPDGDPLPENNQLTYDKEAGFTEDIKLEVANNSADSVTTHDMQYSISLIESGPNPLFDLYLDDGLGGKTRCENNVINGTLAGSTALSESYTLSFGLKDGVTSPAPGNYPVNLVLSSSEPYTRTYTFKLNIQVEDSNMIQIPGTDIERPNVEIREGEIMVFKEEKYEYLTVEDLLVEHLIINNKVQELGRTDLIGGSLYVPASAGNLMVSNWNQHINWDVYGHIVLEPDILVNAWKPVNMVSHAGDVILNNTTIAGNTQPYQVNITAETGNIEANGTTINSRSAESGIIKLAAQNDINLTSADISSAGDDGVNIQSAAGDIDASNASIVSTNGARTAAVVLKTPGFINLNGARVESKGSAQPPESALLIESTANGISAKNAQVTCTNGGTYLEIRARDFIDLEQSSIISHGTHGLKLICTEGGINAGNTIIKSYNQGPNAKMLIQAAGSIDLDGSIVESNSSIQPPNPALLIESTEQGIKAKYASITSTAYGGLLQILAQGFIELDQATLSSGGNMNIQSQADISAKSANLFNNDASKNGHGILLKSINGAIDLSAFEVVGIPQTIIKSPDGNVEILAKKNIYALSAKITTENSNYNIELNSSNGEINLSSSSVAGLAITDLRSEGNILIEAGQDIHCISSRLTASNKSGKELRFESTGVGRKLYVNDAYLGGASILAVGLQIEGVPANGNIQ
jgi:hypothetical protein